MPTVAGPAADCGVGIMLTIASAAVRDTSLFTASILPFVLGDHNRNSLVEQSYSSARIVSVERLRPMAVPHPGYHPLQRRSFSVTDLVLTPVLLVTLLLACAAGFVYSGFAAWRPTGAAAHRSGAITA